MTGSLGNVMKESAKVAFNYTKSCLEKDTNNFAKELKILQKCKVNVHAPEGAVPKDGPSAGIALTTAIISALTEKVIPRRYGMTGVISLSGKVSKIGGLNEKLTAAVKKGLKTVFVPSDNQRELEEVPSKIKDKLNTTLVNDYFLDVWKKLVSVS